MRPKSGHARSFRPHGLLAVLTALAMSCVFAVSAFAATPDQAAGAPAATVSAAVQHETAVTLAANTPRRKARAPARPAQAAVAAAPIRVAQAAPMAPQAPAGAPLSPAGYAAPESQGYGVASQPAEYILSPNDRVRVTVFGEPNLSGEFVVDASGNISMPLIGEARAAGMNLRNFQRALEAELRRGYLVDPRVSAEILNFRPFYVLGQVARPGEYPYASGLTLLNAIAQAGGFTPLANVQQLAIRRENATAEQTIAIQAGIPVLPGDTIRVEKAAVYIFGEVQRPGEYPIPPGLNVVTAVAQAGGYTTLADNTTVHVKRAGEATETAVPAATGQLVMPGDTLRVGKSSFFILGEVARPGEYPLTQALNITNAGALAGGFTYRADQRRVFIRRAGEKEERSYRVTNDLAVRQGDTIRIPERFF
jgi:polysaccharide export outer membrane protein